MGVWWYGSMVIWGSVSMSEWVLVWGMQSSLQEYFKVRHLMFYCPAPCPTPIMCSPTLLDHRPTSTPEKRALILIIKLTIFDNNDNYN